LSDITLDTGIFGRIIDFPQSVVIAGKYRGYMDRALYIPSSYGVKRPHIVLRYKPNFMFKG